MIGGSTSVDIFDNFATPVRASTSEELTVMLLLIVWFFFALSRLFHAKDIQRGTTIRLELFRRGKFTLDLTGSLQNVN